MLPSRLDNMRDDYDLGTFIMVTNDAMDLEIACCNNTGLHAMHHFPSCIPPSITQPTILSALPKPASLPSLSVHNVDTVRGLLVWPDSMVHLVPVYGYNSFYLSLHTVCPLSCSFSSFHCCCSAPHCQRTSV